MATSDVPCGLDCYAPFDPRWAPSCENCLKSDYHGGKCAGGARAGAAVVADAPRGDGEPQP
jgi:hypothetical protein